MINKHRNLILIGIMLTLVAIVALFGIYQYSRNERGSSTTSNSWEQAGYEWLEYSDEAYGFRISYPNSLRAIPLKEADVTGPNFPSGGVSFATLGPGTMGVKIYKNTPYTSTDEWLAQENAERETLRKEKIIRIDGYDALVTYYVSVMPEFEETFPDEKRTVFLKDGDLYEIWTKFYDHSDAHQIVWNSFQFYPTTNN